MVLTQGWALQGSFTAAITSAADLVAGDTLISSAITVSTQGYVYMDMILNLPNGIGSTITVEQPVELYVIPAVDGSTYPDFDTNATDVLVPQNLYVGAFMVRAEATASTAQKLAMLNLIVPPTSFKLGIRNNTGQSLKDGATHFTLSYQFKAPTFA